MIKYSFLLNTQNYLFSFFTTLNSFLSGESPKLSFASFVFDIILFITGLSVTGTKRGLLGIEKEEKIFFFIPSFLDKILLLITANY
jgi:hypothetical protein